MAEKKSSDRGPKPLTSDDFRTTAKTLETYSKAFLSVAETMEKQGLSHLGVTGALSVRDFLKRVDAHYESCREQLGYLAVGEKFPSYSFEKKEQPRNTKRSRKD